MVQDDAVYRCIGLQCGRLMPRRVNYCPWCGTAQQVVQPPGMAPPVLAKPPAEPPRAAPAPHPHPHPHPLTPAPAPLPSAAAPAPTSAPTPAPPSAQAASASASAASAASAAAAAPAAAGVAGSQYERGIPLPPGVGRGAPAPARPPQRAPIRMRWWILALAALWLIWMLVRPSGTLIERRMDRAVALAVECKARQAQDELIDLRKTRATPEQLRQVQQSLNKAAADCTRAEQRARAWDDTSAAIQKLRRARAYDKAVARLGTFTRRWGEDDQTRALKQEIIDEREHPLADPTRGE